MENYKIKYLFQSNKFIQRGLKHFKQIIEMKRSIHNNDSDLETDGKTLLQREILTQEEREINESLCQKNEELFQSEETNQLFQVIFKELYTKSLNQQDNHSNGLYTKIKEKTKKIKRICTSKSNLDKFQLCNKKIQRKKLLKQLKNLLFLNNQILSFQTQSVNFNMEEGKPIDIKVFINTDLLFNMSSKEDWIKNKTQIDQNFQEKESTLQKQSIVVNFRQQLKIQNEDMDQEPELINKSKKIGFKELVGKIEIENKQYLNKLSSKQKLNYVNTNPQQKSHNLKLIKVQEIVIDDEEDIKEKELKEKQTPQIIESFYYGEELKSPDKKASAAETTTTNFHQIIQNEDSIIIIGTSCEEQDSCQIIDFNNFNRSAGQSQIEQNSKSAREQNALESNIAPYIYQTMEVLSDQNKKNVLEKLSSFKNEKAKNNEEVDQNIFLLKVKQFCTNNQKLIYKQRQKFLKKQRKLQNQKQREFDRQIKRDREIERRREIKNKERDILNENERQNNLVQDIEKKKKRQQLLEKRIQYFKEHNRKDRNRPKNKDLTSLENVSQQLYNHLKSLKQQNQDSKKNNKQQQQQQQQQQQDQQSLQQQSEQYTKQQIQNNQSFDFSDIHQQKQIDISQQQKQIEENNFIQNFTKYQFNHQISQLITNNIQNYNYSNQTQYQVPMNFQIYSPFLSNPQFYNQFMPGNQKDQQSFGQISGSDNMYKDFLQLQMINYYQTALQHYNTTQYIQFPQAFLPQNSALGDTLK